MSEPEQKTDSANEPGIVLTAEQQKRRKQRNFGIAAVLVGLVAIIWLLTIFKLGPGVMNRPL